MDALRPRALLAVGVVGVAGYVLVARAVSKRKTVAKDHKARRKIQRTRTHGGELAAQASGPLGKEWFYIPVAGAVSGYLWKQQRGSRAITPVLASVVVEAVSRVLDRLPPHRQPPPGQPNRQKPSFPSGHAMETMAVSMTTAYVLSREKLVSPAPAFIAAAVVSLLSPIGRIYLDRHWVADAVGGACAGLAVAAASAAAYEALDLRV